MFLQGCKFKVMTKYKYLRFSTLRHIVTTDFMYNSLELTKLTTKTIEKSQEILSGRFISH